MLQCPQYAVARQEIQDGLQLLGVTLPLSVKLLLGGEDLCPKKQLGIQNLMLKYLVESDKLYTI